MRNIENFLQNNKYFDERFWGEDEMTFTIKENPQLCLHIYNGYINSIHDNPLTDEKGRWIGFTRDDNEFIRTYSGYPANYRVLHGSPPRNGKRSLLPLRDL